MRAWAAVAALILVFSIALPEVLGSGKEPITLLFENPKKAGGTCDTGSISYFRSVCCKKLITRQLDTLSCQLGLTVSYKNQNDSKNGNDRCGHCGEIVAIVINPSTDTIPSALTHRKSNIPTILMVFIIFIALCYWLIR